MIAIENEGFRLLIRYDASMPKFHGICLSPRLKPGLFITATDTGVGKTVITCAIAAALRRRSGTPKSDAIRVGVFKPMATGCRQDREGLVSEDAEALAHFADCRQPLEVICPIRYRPAMAPGVAAELTGIPTDWSALDRSLRVLDETHDTVLVEGVGGVLVPLDARDCLLTVRELAVALGYPVVVVTRATLGTLNHTAMTVDILRQAGCRIAGLVINGFDPDSSKLSREEDRVMVSNRVWLTRMTGLPVLATVPVVRDEPVRPHLAQIPPAILDTVALTCWGDVAAAPEQ